MTDRKRTTAVQVRVTEQEKRRMERQAKKCGLSLSGYLRRVGVGTPVTAFPSQRFHDLYRQVNGLQENCHTGLVALLLHLVGGKEDPYHCGDVFVDLLCPTQKSLPVPLQVK